MALAGMADAYLSSCSWTAATQADQAASVTQQTVSEWCNHHRTRWGLHQKRVDLVVRAERTELERA